MSLGYLTARWLSDAFCPKGREKEMGRNQTERGGNRYVYQFITKPSSLRLVRAKLYLERPLAAGLKK